MNAALLAALEARLAESRSEWRRLADAPALDAFLAEAAWPRAAQGGFAAAGLAADGRGVGLVEGLIAETGTLILSARHPGARRTAFLAETHFALAAEECLYPTLADWLAAVGRGRRHRPRRLARSRGSLAHLDHGPEPHGRHREDPRARRARPTAPRRGRGAARPDRHALRPGAARPRGAAVSGGATASARSLRGWYLYDWANSAFATVILAALLPVYFAEAVVPAGGARLLGTRLSATTLWGYASACAALLVFLSAPLLGALADASRARRRWLIGCFLPGALATSLLFTVGPGDVGLALGLYIAAATLFIAANIFYDSFLPTLGPPTAQDAISARGFAWGYAGGGLIFLLDLVLIQLHGSFGLSKAWAVRLALSSAGLWWGGFGLLAWHLMEEPPGPPARRVSALGATRDTWASFRRVLARPALAVFCLAFLFYNDGVQTVVKMASIYGKDELHLGTGTLLGTLLLVQIIGVPGALLFGRLAGRIGTRGAADAQPRHLAGRGALGLAPRGGLGILDARAPPWASASGPRSR